MGTATNDTTFFEAETMLMEDAVYPFYTILISTIYIPAWGIYPNLMDSLNLKYVRLNPELRWRSIKTI